MTVRSHMQLYEIHGKRSEKVPKDTFFNLNEEKQEKVIRVCNK